MTTWPMCGRPHDLRCPDCEDKYAFSAIVERWVSPTTILERGTWEDR